MHDELSSVSVCRAALKIKNFLVGVGDVAVETVAPCDVFFGRVGGRERERRVGGFEGKFRKDSPPRLMIHHTPPPPLSLSLSLDH